MATEVSVHGVTKTNNMCYGIAQVLYCGMYTSFVMVQLEYYEM